jgi:hypothetical protein
MTAKTSEALAQTLDALGKDVTGRAMAKAYKERLGEVLKLMIEVAA